MPDVEVHNCDSIILLAPNTDAADAWFQKHTPDAMRHGAAIVVEPRFVADIVFGLRDSGITVS